MRFSISIIASLLLLTSTYAFPTINKPKQHPTRSTPITTHTLPPTLLYQFPNNTWLENFAIRPNGQLLITLITTPEIYLWDPLSPSEVTHITTLPSYVSLLGIASPIPDIYYFVAGNWTSAAGTVPGTYAIWKLDMRVSSPKVVKILDMPKAQFLNGLDVLSPSDGTLLVADSVLGLVWKINIFTRTYDVFIDVPEMKIAVNSTLQLGINGIHIFQNALYFTSMTQELYCRISLNPTHNSSHGAVETLATGIFGDDFTIDRFGNSWITQDPMDLMTLVIGEGSRKGEVFTLAGREGTKVTQSGVPYVVGATRAAFGVLEEDEDVLYVVTNGGIAAAKNGVVGGEILSFDTAGFLNQILG
ncbi:Calcium-dependent phosphotriesterase [Glarea lozoyensis ATCC 20868]|uniref:Calcium-dependent phosphotriesterase n=1 Tax=Glarea lozoyensis (strain ATCC 20868 / MF5171) TaxID=1116229 RepID=S3CUV6_GLAL2|nr:Calcium-dependent phosphotriesterase [Glarea lozoyensis ATCC 20868]EPE29425.1 Calcium-dependent phosphotriesterase [Glarea lozoyensis ATCC 20868]